MSLDHDDPTNSELQQYEEKRVFEEFVEYASLPVIAESIQSRESPEPDIYCELSGGDRIAYELGELCDEGFRLGYGTMLQSRELLQQGIAGLEPSTREKFVQKYSDAFISVQFVPAASLRRRAQTIAAFYQWLSQSGPTSGELSDTQLPAEFSGIITKLAISRNRPRLVGVRPMAKLHFLKDMRPEQHPPDALSTHFGEADFALWSQSKQVEDNIASPLV